MSEADTFLIIKGDSDSLLKEKGSKFIGFATHVIVVQLSVRSSDLNNPKTEIVDATGGSAIIS